MDRINHTILSKPVEITLWATGYYCREKNAKSKNVLFIV